MSDVGYVHYRLYLVTVVLQHAAQLVHKDVGAHIADVRVLVHRRTAGVNPRLSRLYGHKLFLFARKRVVKPQLHSVTSLSLGSPHLLRRNRSGIFFYYSTTKHLM